MLLFPAYADAASRDPDLSGVDPAELDPDELEAFADSGLDIDQWTDPAWIGGYIRELRAQGASWQACVAEFSTDIPVFVARCWAAEELVRSRHTLRRIRQDIETAAATGGLSDV